MPEDSKPKEAPQEEKKYAEIPDSLDDAVVGNAEGKPSKYEIPKHKSTRLVFTGTLRNRVFWSFILFFVVYVIVILIGYIFMHDGLSKVDNSLCEHNVERFALELNSRLSREADLITRFATFDDMYESVEAAANGNMAPLQALTLRKFYTSGAEQKWDTSLDLNLLVVFDLNFNVMMQHYFPPSPATGDLEDDTVSTKEKIVENVDGELFRHHGTTAWRDVLYPISQENPMFVAFAPITMHTVASNASGYLVLGREIKGRVRTAASSIPTCLTSYFGASAQTSLQHKDDDAFKKSTPGTINPSTGVWSGKTTFAGHMTDWMDQDKERFCPGNMLFEKTEEVMVCYMRVKNQKEEQYVTDHGKTYYDLYFRLDIPTTVRVKGNPTLVGIVIEIMVIVAILLIIFFIYIDRAVLNRIRELSEIISQQTRATEANKDLDISDGNGEDGIELTPVGKSRSGRRSGKDSGHKGNRSNTSTDSTGSSNSSGQREDEVGRLRRAMEENALALRNKMDQADQALSQEQAYASRHKQALQLLNLWCGRKEYFPGLRTNALQLRYEPNRGLEDLLANPLAVEYLKVHCASEKTLENLLFLIDVAWLHEVEIAQANASDSVQREQLGAVAENAAQTIRARYIADDAPQPINISADTQERIAKGSEHYSLGMFDQAEQEVKLMLDTDILPRFKKTLAYTAMSETLFFDQTSGLDDVSASAFSDEAGSTAGSVLTDESDEMEGISRNFAHAFNRLHAAGTGTAGTTTAGGAGTTTTMTTATTTTDGTDGSSVVSESKKHTGTNTTTMSTTETSEGELDEEGEDLEDVDDKKKKDDGKGKEKDKGKKADGSPEGSASSSSSSHASSDLGSASDSSNSSSLSSSGDDDSDEKSE